MFFKTLKSIGLSLLLFVLYLLIQALISPIFKGNYVYYSLIGALIFIGIFVYYQRKELIKKLKNIKKDFHLKTFLIGLLLCILSIISEQILVRLLGDTSVNQVQVINYLKDYPIIFGLSIIFIIPFAEEIIFRYPYKNIKRIIAITVSSIIFTFVHLKGLSDLYFIVPYLLGSIAISMNFTKNDNIYISYFMHAINNIIVMLLLIW